LILADLEFLVQAHADAVPTDEHIQYLHRLATIYFSARQFSKAVTIFDRLIQNKKATPDEVENRQLATLLSSRTGAAAINAALATVTAPEEPAQHRRHQLKVAAAALWAPDAGKDAALAKGLGPLKDDPLGARLLKSFQLTKKAVTDWRNWLSSPETTPLPKNLAAGSFEVVRGALVLFAAPDLKEVSGNRLLGALVASFPKDQSLSKIKWPDGANGAGAEVVKPAVTTWWRSRPIPEEFSVFFLKRL